MDFVNYHQTIRFEMLFRGRRLPEEGFGGDLGLVGAQSTFKRCEQGTLAGLKHGTI